MKRSYNKAGLSVLALYGAMSVVSSLALTIFTGIGAVVMLMKDRRILDLFQGSSKPDIRALYTYVESSDLFAFVIIGLMVGSALGMFVGIKVMKKLLPERENIPIPKKPLTGKEIFFMIMMAFGLWGIGAFIGNLPEWFGIGVPNTILSSRRKIMLVYYAYAMIGAPFFEELAFRKTLLNALHPYGEAQAAFATALLFGLMHGNPAQFILAFTLGLLLAAVYQRTGKIIYTMLLHFLINTSATIPDILIMFIGHEETITIIWYIVMGTIILAGLVMVFIFGKKQEFLSLSETGNPDANRNMFKNVGMRIAVIGGMVLVAGTEAVTFIACITSGDFGAEVLLRLVPLALSIVIIILVMKMIGKPFTIKAEAVPEIGPGREE